MKSTARVKAMRMRRQALGLVRADVFILPAEKPLLAAFIKKLEAKREGNHSGLDQTQDGRGGRLS
jgi:hypothetical protein